MFHRMLAHNNFSSVWVAECPPIGKSCALGWPYVLIVFFLFVIFICFPFWFYE